LVFVRAPAILPVLMLAWGFGWTMSHAGLSTFLTDLDSRYMKEISSLNSSVRFMAGGAGVVLGGWIMQQSFALGFLIYALVLGGLFLATNFILTGHLEARLNH
jgi:predicted MFS family arabinose efflux permease